MKSLGPDFSLQPDTFLMATRQLLSLASYKGAWDGYPLFQEAEEKVGESR